MKATTWFNVWDPPLIDPPSYMIRLPTCRIYVNWSVETAGFYVNLSPSQFTLLILISPHNNWHLRQIWHTPKWYRCFNWSSKILVSVQLYLLGFGQFWISPLVGWFTFFHTDRSWEDLPNTYTASMLSDGPYREDNPKLTRGQIIGCHHS